MKYITLNSALYIDKINSHFVKRGRKMKNVIKHTLGRILKNKRKEHGERR